MVKKWLMTALFVLIAAGPLFAANMAGEGVILGKARVVDGDTLRIGAIPIRLQGIDAPEIKQTCRTEHGVEWACGRVVTQVLTKMVKGRTVSCIGAGLDKYGRTLAKCSVDGQDIGAYLVENGLALAYRKYSSDYVSAEIRAAHSDTGFWSGAVQTPAAFRVAAQQSTKPPNAACAIKGNISKGGRIYHVPGSKWYNKTKIDPRAGERWFCSVSDAQKAGWRAPHG
jgi:endonuclease YncB( thermonuclease family)